MKIHKQDPPRAFKVGAEGAQTTIKDCAHITLSDDEQVTFLTASGGEYDVAKKSWGFYATPSLNGRLLKHGLRAVMIKNSEDKFFLLLVEKGKEDELKAYLKAENESIVCYLDSTESLNKLLRIEQHHENK